MSSKYLIDERPLTVQPTIVRVMGFEKAVIVQQFHWLLNQPRTGIEHEGARWIWGTYEQWCEDFFTFWQPRTLRKHINDLEGIGVLLSAQLNPDRWNKTKYYTIDYATLDEAIVCHPVATSNSHDDATSMWHDPATSMWHDDDASYIGTKQSTKKTTNNGGSRPFSDVTELYHNNIGFLSVILADELQELCDTYTPDWVYDAIKVAVESEKRNLRYVKGILRNWHSNGRQDTRGKGGVDWEETIGQIADEVPEYLK